MNCLSLASFEYMCDRVPLRVIPRVLRPQAFVVRPWDLLPHAAQVKVAHPVMLRAIAASKKKNDKIDAGKIADCLRCDFLPECHMVSTEIRHRRRTLRYRHLVVRQMVQMKNRVSGLLLETGVPHNKQRLHKVKYSENCSPRTQKWRKASGHCSSSAANPSNDCKRP